MAVPSKGEGVEDLHDEGDEVVAATKVHLRCCFSCDACTRHPHRSEVAAVRCIVREWMRNDNLREKALRTLPTLIVRIAYMRPRARATLTEVRWLQCFAW